MGQGLRRSVDEGARYSPLRRRGLLSLVVLEGMLVWFVVLGAIFFLTLGYSSEWKNKLFKKFFKILRMLKIAILVIFVQILGSKDF